MWLHVLAWWILACTRVVSSYLKAVKILEKVQCEDEVYADTGPYREMKMQVERLAQKVEFEKADDVEQLGCIPELDLG